MSKVTAFSEKLAAQGVLPQNVELQIAIAKYQNNGGPYGVALAMLNAAYGRGKSAGDAVPQGQRSVADDPRTNAAKGQPACADKAVGDLPDAATRSQPGHAKRGLAAIASVQEAVSRPLQRHAAYREGPRSCGRTPLLSLCPNPCRSRRAGGAVGEAGEGRRTVC